MMISTMQFRSGISQLIAIVVCMSIFGFVGKYQLLLRRIIATMLMAIMLMLTERNRVYWLLVIMISLPLLLVLEQESMFRVST